MKVNDLIEFLEYSPSSAPVSVAIVDKDGRVVRHDEPLFLAQDGRVYLIVDEHSDGGCRAGVPTDEINLSGFDRPQLFGHRFVLLRKPPE